MVIHTREDGYVLDSDVNSAFRRQASKTIREGGARIGTLAGNHDHICSPLLDAQRGDCFDGERRRQAAIPHLNTHRWKSIYPPDSPAPVLVLERKKRTQIDFVLNSDEITRQDPHREGERITGVSNQLLDSLLEEGS